VTPLLPSPRWWNEYVVSFRMFLEDYPPELFTAESGDPGPQLVQDIAVALRRYDEGMHRR
jgi:hypothetical protein